MYEAGDLLKFSPFEFKNGSQAKPKYFIVLGHIDEKVMMATLPSQTFLDLKDCIKKAQMLRRKYRKLL